MTHVYVESKVTRSKSGRTKNRIVIAQPLLRFLRRLQSSPNLIFPTLCADIIQMWILATSDLYHGHLSSIAEYDLQNTTTSFLIRKLAYLGNISATDLSVRLGQLINTFLLGSKISTACSSLDIGK